MLTHIIRYLPYGFVESRQVTFKGSTDTDTALEEV